MIFDPENKIFQLCAKGMELEGANPAEAAALFMQAWNEADSFFDKSVAAHYVARRQESIEDKLEWDETALDLAMQCDGQNARALLPSLYLNVGKGHEDLNRLDTALEHYQMGLAYSNVLDEDGYGKMIHSGLKNGIARVS